MSGQVLIAVGDAAETLDTYYPLLRLAEDRLAPVVAAPEARTVHLVSHQVPPGWDVTREFEGYTLEATVAFRDVEPEAFLGLYLTGGRAPEYLRYDQDLLRIVRALVAAGRPVASVCHGVEILAAAGCLEGRRVATVPKCRLDVEQAGGVFVDEACVTDGCLVTGRTWADCGPVVGEWIRRMR